MRESENNAGTERLLEDAAFLARLARRLVADPALADDLSQETLLVALEHPPRQGGSIRAWLATVAANLALNARRAAGRRTARERLVARPEVSAAEDLSQERIETQRLLFEQVLSLAPEQRTVLYLRYYEGLGPAAIAARLGVPLKTVKSRQTRALASLRERLDARSQGDRSAWMSALLPLTLARHGGPASGALSTLIGAMLMKKVIVLAAALLILVLAWFARERLDLGLSGAHRGVGQGESAPLVAHPAPAAAAPLAPEALEQRQLLEPPSLTDAMQAAATGGLDVSLRWADGGAATGVGVELLLPRQRGTREEFLRNTTDAQGHARFEDLAAGQSVLRVDMRGAFDVHIEAGITSAVEFELRPSISVRGRVLDERGLPVPNAGLWTAGGYWLAPNEQQVGNCDAQGEFLLRDVSAYANLGARSPGFLPSLCLSIEDLPATQDGSRVIDLVLKRGGGSLRGRVHDPEGRPLAGARVLAGPDGGVGERFGDIYGTRPDPAPVLTRADGSFDLLDQLEAGVQEVHAAARGLPVWSGTVLVTQQATCELEIRMGRPARIEGRVVGVDGQPLAGIDVLAAVEHHGGWYSTPFPASRDCTDAEGWFVLDWVAAGEVELNAHDDERPQLGRARATLSCREGQTEYCELKLSLGNTIAGRVVDEAGAPLAGWGVYAEPSDFFTQSYPRRARTALDGSFVLANLGNCAHDLSVRGPDHGPTRVQLSAVACGKRDLEIEVPGAHLAAGQLRARWVDPSGAPMDNLRFTLWPKGLNEGHFLDFDAHSGLVTATAPPGTYRLVVSRVQQELLALPEVELVAGGITDLGDLVCAELGGVELELHGMAPELLAKMKLYLERPGSSDLELELVNGVWSCSRVPGGHWKIALVERELRLSPDVVEVRPGATTRVSASVELARSAGQ